jgi:hypothetical protein
LKPLPTAGEATKIIFAAATKANTVMAAFALRQQIDPPKETHEETNPGVDR